MPDSLLGFLTLWVALMPDRLGYDDSEGEGGSSRSKESGYEPTPPTPPTAPIAKARADDGAAISAIRNVPSVANLSADLVI